MFNNDRKAEDDDVIIETGVDGSQPTGMNVPPLAQALQEGNFSTVLMATAIATKGGNQPKLTKDQMIRYCDIMARGYQQRVSTHPETAQDSTARAQAYAVISRALKGEDIPSSDLNKSLAVLKSREDSEKLLAKSLEKETVNWFQREGWLGLPNWAWAAIITAGVLGLGYAAFRSGGWFNKKKTATTQSVVPGTNTTPTPTVPTVNDGNDNSSTLEKIGTIITPGEVTRGTNNLMGNAVASKYVNNGGDYGN